MDLLVSKKKKTRAKAESALRKSRVSLLTFSELKMNTKKLSVNVHRLKEN